MKTKDIKSKSTADDTPRQAQTSHRDTQNRSKKDGHTTQIGTGQDQQSQRNRGGGARKEI